MFGPRDHFSVSMSYMWHIRKVQVLDDNEPIRYKDIGSTNTSQYMPLSEKVTKF